MCGWGYSFSMWQTLQMWQTLSKCILLDFPTKIVGFSNSFSRAKAVPLHRISKRAEYGISEDRVRKIIRSP